MPTAYFLTFGLFLHPLSPSRSALVKTILAFGAIYIIWGSTYAGIVLAIESIPPFFMTGIRFLVAGVLLYGYCLLRGMPAPGWKLTWQNTFAGFLMLACGTGTVTWVEQHIASGLTAILVAIAPLWYVILDKRLWQYHFSNVSIVVGLITGMAGVILLFTDGESLNFSSGPLSLVSAFVMLIGNILWVAGSLYVKYNVTGGSPLVRASIQMLSAGIILILAGFINGEDKNFSASAVTLESFLALLYLVVFGSLDRRRERKIRDLLRARCRAGQQQHANEDRSCRDVHRCPPRVSLRTRRQHPQAVSFS